MKKSINLEIARKGPQLEISFSKQEQTLTHYEESPVTPDELGKRCNELMHLLNMVSRRGSIPSSVIEEMKQMGRVLYNEIFPLSIEDDRRRADPAEGEKLYYETSLGTNAGCRICHSLQPGVTLVGPSFAGIATRAAERVPGVTAEEYLRQSILAPDAYIVEGFPGGQMVPNLDETLSEDQIEDIVAFLLTLE